MKRIPKPILFTLLYYIAAALLYKYFSTIDGFKTGLCNPGLDLLWPFLVFLSSILLTVIYFVRVRLGRVNLYVTLIHLSVSVAFVILLIVDSMRAR